MNENIICPWCEYEHTAEDIDTYTRVQRGENYIECAKCGKFIIVSYEAQYWYWTEKYTDPNQTKLEV